MLLFAASSYACIFFLKNENTLEKRSMKDVNEVEMSESSANTTTPHTLTPRTIDANMSTKRTTTSPTRCAHRALP